MQSAISINSCSRPLQTTIKPLLKTAPPSLIALLPLPIATWAYMQFSILAMNKQVKKSKTNIPFHNALIFNGVSSSPTTSYCALNVYFIFDFYLIIKFFYGIVEFPHHIIKFFII